MKKRVVIGIDTSNYTTSYAIISIDGELVANLKRPLPVKAGERGLRQSDAVFAHVKNLPDLASEAKSYLEDCEIVAIGVSEKPRNIEGSYMPCFLAGVAVAENLAGALGVPLYRFSHQCGHIMAAVFSAGRFDLLEAPFAAYHVSGGTTELLRLLAMAMASRPSFLAVRLILTQDRLSIESAFIWACLSPPESILRSSRLNAQ